MKNNYTRILKEIDCTSTDMEAPSFHLEVEIEGIGEDELEAVVWAVGDAWDYSFILGPGGKYGGCLKFLGWGHVPGSEPAEVFARYISRIVWAAAGGYRPVRVYATVSDDYPCDEFETGEADYRPGVPPNGPSDDEDPGCSASPERSDPSG